MFARSAESGRLRNWDLDTEPPSGSYRYRTGRRDLLLVTMIITGLGSVLTAVVDNYAWFVAARTITGIGICADLAIVNTYINEMAPRHGRARYTALIFLFSALGAVLGIWLGLWLTTPATPLPMGLPFAIAGPGFEYGWRIMYLIGGALALIGVLPCFQLLQQAAAVIDMMEHRASACISLAPVERTVVPRVGDLQTTLTPRSSATQCISDA